jgi:hypothetical protein
MLLNGGLTPGAEPQATDCGPAAGAAPAGGNILPVGRAIGREPPVPPLGRGGLQARRAGVGLSKG